MTIDKDIVPLQSHERVPPPSEKDVAARAESATMNGDIWDGIRSLERQMRQFQLQLQELKTRAASRE